MAVQPKPEHPVFVSPEEYLAFERAREFRHEYHGGEIVATSGATFEHNLDARMNPALVVEVLSGSTEAFDRGEKFLRYQRIESLREYVLVSQTGTQVERFTRAGGDWTYHAALGRAAAVALESVGVTLRLADVYEGVETPGDAEDDAPDSGDSGGGGGVE